MKRAISYCKQAALPLLSAVQRGTCDGKTLVLAYHRVEPAVTWDPHGLALTSREFDRQLGYLSRTYELVPLQAALAGSEAIRDSSRRRVAITFDDGYATTLAEAVPLLDKYRARAVLFAVTGCLETTRHFWWDLAAVGAGPGVDHLKRLPAKERDSRLRKQPAAARAAQRPGLPEAAAPRQLQQWLDAGHVLGGHSHTHPCLAALDDETLNQELTHSYSAVAALSREVEIPFAYPFGGVGDFDDRTGRAVERVGFSCALTTIAGSLPGTGRSFSLPRLCVRSRRLGDFAVAVARAFSRSWDGRR